MPAEEVVAYTLGESGAPIPVAPAASLRDALPRPHTLLANRAGCVNRVLRDVRPDDTSLAGAELAAVQAELALRMGALQAIMGGKLFGNPAGQPSCADLTLIKDWGGGRPEDVVMAVPAKSGTTWALHIGHQLRAGGAPVSFDNQMDVITWLECGHAMYGHDLDAAQAHGPPRIFKSHLPWAALPRGTKRLFVFRELSDAWLSSYRFILSFGGLQRKVPIAVYYPESDRAKLRRKADSALANLSDWWAHRNDPGVLLLFYDGMRADPAAATSRIAGLMGIPDSEDGLLFRTVTEQTSHAAMAAARGPNGQDPFDDHNFADVCAHVLGLGAQDRDILSGKVRRGGGASGEGAVSLPRWLVQELEAAWSEVIGGPLGFTDLSEMTATHEAELAA